MTNFFKKFVFCILFVGYSLSYATHHDLERLFLEDVQSLPCKTILSSSGKKIKLYTVEPDKFNDIFPFNYVNKSQIDDSDYVGKITSDLSSATGVLLEVEEDKNGNLIGYGVTNLHTFFEFNQSGKLKFVDASLPIFFQGQKKISSSENEFFFHSSINISNYKTLKNCSKDLCLFSGQLTINSDEPENIAKVKFMKVFGSSDLLERIEQNYIQGDLETECTMYYYPLGVEGQRKNTATIALNDQHKIVSLSGSSGSPIFSKKGKIMAIHASGGSASDTVPDVQVKIEAPHTIGRPQSSTLTTYNNYVPFSLTDYNDLKNGIEVIWLNSNLEALDKLKVFLTQG